MGWDDWINEYEDNFNNHLRLIKKKSNDGNICGETVKSKQNMARLSIDIHSFSYIHSGMLVTFSKYYNL